MAMTTTEVVLHIYDVTYSGSDKLNNTIVQIKKIFKDSIGLGGIFHSAVQVFLLINPSAFINMLDVFLSCFDF